MAWNIDIPEAQWFTGDALKTPGIESLIREIEDQPVCAIDTETTGLNYMKDFTLYWSLSWEERGRAGNYKRATLRADALPYFSHIFKDPDRSWTFVNAKFDLHMQHNVGVNFAGRVFDTSVMHALLYEEQPHNLAYMARQLLGWGWKDDFKKGFKEFGPRAFLCGLEETDLARLVEYASNDAYGTLQLFYKLKKELEEATTWSLYPEQYATLADYFFKIEAPFTQVLWRMERRGMFINEQYLRDADGPATKEIQQVEREITHIVGRPINMRSGDQMIQYFFREKGYQAKKLTSGGKSGIKKESTDADTIEWLAEEYNDPVAERMLVLRDLYKLKGTYIDGILENLDPRNRVHTHFNQDTARCMPAGELVLTSRGYLPVEQVKLGDSVISHTGKTRQVTCLSTHEPQPIYRVRLKNGLQLRTNGSHPYRIGEQWVRADQLQLGTNAAVHSDAEAWSPLPDWPSYEVSSWGRVRNIVTHNVLTQQPKGRWGHLKISLSRNGCQIRGEDRKDFSIHRLVLQTFGGPGSGEVRHLNGISWDNTIRNLQWGTPSENRQDARRHGTLSQRRAGRTLLTEQQVEQIRATPRAAADQALSRAKLTREQVQSILARSTGKRGEQTAFAAECGVTVQAINRLFKGKVWQKDAPNQEGKTDRQLAEEYGVSVTTIQDVRVGRRWHPEDYIEGSAATFFESEIVEITIEPAEVTYGLTIEEDCSHVTGGIVTHNTGRLSTSDIQFQNIPTAENDKFKIRRAFCHEPGNKLIVADQEQLEMRLLAAATVTADNPEGERDMIQLFLDGKDIHMGNASLVFEIPYDDLVKAKKVDKDVKAGKLPEAALDEYLHRCLEARQAAKAIGFGLNYGMKEAKLARSIKKTKEQAKALIDQYMGRYPSVANFYLNAIEAARQCGYSFTILGRRRFHPEIVSSNKMERWGAERKAVNNEIQGTAADVLKMAMIQIDGAGLEYSHGCMMINQVHDELIFECPDDMDGEVMPIIKDLMEHPFDRDLIVPLIASIGSGANWLDAK